MYSKIIILFVTATYLAMAVAISSGSPQTMDLRDAFNRSVCPFVEAEPDVDPERIPKIIKVTRCAADPVGTCKAHGIPLEDCCPKTRGDHIRECVEIRDTVNVYYPNGITPDEAKPYEVSVGCACVHFQSVPASFIQGH